MEYNDPFDIPLIERTRATPTSSSAIRKPTLGDYFSVKKCHLKLIRENLFDGRTNADPHMHIAKYTEICNLFHYTGSPNDNVKLCLFQWSLTGEAKTWFEELDSDSIFTWDQMIEVFVTRFFPLALFRELFREIQMFTQEIGETTIEAWVRLKDMIRNCHGHGLGKDEIIEIFYYGLDENSQTYLDSVGGGIFFYKSANDAYKILDDQVLFELYKEQNYLKHYDTTEDIWSEADNSDYQNYDSGNSTPIYNNFYNNNSGDVQDRLSVNHYYENQNHQECQSAQNEEMNEQFEEYFSDDEQVDEYYYEKDDNEELEEIATPDTKLLDEDELFDRELQEFLEVEVDIEYTDDMDYGDITLEVLEKIFDSNTDQHSETEKRGTKRISEAAELGLHNGKAIKVISGKKGKSIKLQKSVNHKNDRYKKSKKYSDKEIYKKSNRKDTLINRQTREWNDAWVKRRKMINVSNKLLIFEYHAIKILMFSH